jgi:hypothetical protein
MPRHGKDAPAMKITRITAYQVDLPLKEAAIHGPTATS